MVSVNISVTFETIGVIKSSWPYELGKQYQQIQ